VVHELAGNARIGEVRSWIENAAAVTVLTGAGISTDSGIPDFRGPQADPPCPLCGGILKSATVSFGQSLDPVVLCQARHHQCPSCSDR
jgi:NAD-dependent SIR2 family protein deacetylase